MVTVAHVRLSDVDSFLAELDARPPNLDDRVVRVGTRLLSVGNAMPLLDVHVVATYQRCADATYEVLNIVELDVRVGTIMSNLPRGVERPSGDQRVLDAAADMEQKVRDEVLEHPYPMKLAEGVFVPPLDAARARA